MIRLYNQNIWGNMSVNEKIANRNKLIRSLVEEYQPDVCTFQECNPNTSRQGVDALPVIMGDFYAEASSQDAGHNFTPVFYKKGKYREIDSGFHPYEGKNDLQSKSFTWVVLERILDGLRFGVISTHFWFKHQSEEDILQRLKNVEELEEICKYIVDTYHVPVMIAGDFNNGKQSSQGDEPYQAMINKGFVDVRYSAADTTECHTVHHCPRRNENGEYAYGDVPYSTIDYVFMYGTKLFAAQSFQVDTSQKALCSSDHCPLIADFISLMKDMRKEGKYDMKRYHIFEGQWVTTKESSMLDPVSVFHRQLQRITIPAKLQENLHVLYRKTFILSKSKKTTIYITADDYYKLYINGEFVTQGPAPGFPFHYYYNVIDITPFIKEGENVIAVHTYYQGLINRVWVSGDDRHGLIFDIVQDHEVLVKSDTTVKQTVHTGYSELGQAGYQTQFLECYDCRSNCIGFEQLDYDDSSWEDAFVHQHADYELFEQPTKQLEIEEIEPVCVKKDEQGYFIDFGSIYVGGLYAEAQGQWGDKIIIQCGQELTKEGEVRFDMRANCRYEEMWILSGEEDSLHQYDYKAFRYCRLRVPEGVSLQNIKMIIRHYPFTLIRECSYKDEDLNRIWDLCVNSLKYGVQDVIQDCMDREKGQYMGDGSLSAAALAVITGDTSIMEKLIDDALRTDFINEGFVTCSPCSFMQEMAEYPLMLPQLFLVHWQLKKDAAFLEERYGKLVAMLNFYGKNYGTENGMLDHLDKWFLLDWPKECRDDYDFEWNEGEVMVGIHNAINAYYIGAIKVVNKIAAILNKEPYMDTENLEATYIQLFYDNDKKLFRDTPQSKHASLPSNALALMYDLCPDKETEENIVQLILDTDASKTAFFTTFASLCGLSRIGKKEQVKEVLRNPGRWLRMLKEGATVTFEAWGKDLKWNTSLFHLCYTYAILFLTDWGKPEEFI